MTSKKKKRQVNQMDDGMYTDTAGNSSGIKAAGLLSDKDRNMQGSMGGVNDKGMMNDDELYYGEDDGYDD